MNPRTRRLGDAENPFVVSPDTTENAPRTIGAVPFVSGPMSENVEDRRGEGPDALPSRGTQPANVSDEVPDEEEMKPALKAQAEDNFRMEMKDQQRQRSIFTMEMETRAAKKRK